MLDVYEASVENLKELKKQLRVIKRLANDALRKDKSDQIEALTKIYALLYSAYVEAAFVKMINTPYGFSDDYIRQLSTREALEIKWGRCIEFGFQQIETEHNKGEIANKKQKLYELLDQYIVQPSMVRNKIAHGQWKVALNNVGTAVNSDTTSLLNGLDFVQIDRLFKIYGYFAECVEDLIESPHRAHYNYFYARLTELETYVEKSKDYTLESKRRKLKESCKYHPN